MIINQIVLLMSSSLTPDWSSEFEHYKKLSRKVVTNEDIINFFNQNQKAFYLDTFSSSWVLIKLLCSFGHSTYIYRLCKL